MPFQFLLQNALSQSKKKRPCKYGDYFFKKGIGIGFEIVLFYKHLPLTAKPYSGFYFD